MILSKPSSLAVHAALFSGVFWGCQAPIEGPELAHQQLRQQGPTLLDALDREVLLRGVNAGGRSKFLPFHPFAFAESNAPLQADAPPFEEALAIYLDQAQSWGVNVLRVPFTWEALEPVRGEYDSVFLERYARILEAAGERQIRTIVDFHQDVFARTYCGDGFPLWAAPDPYEPVEHSECHDWFLGYFSGPSRLAFDRFWAGEDGLMEAFEAMWQHMATRTWGIPGVIGYEVINEPGPGTADPSQWGPEVLSPFYERMTDAIRTVAPDALIVFDTTGLEGVEGSTAMTRPQREGLLFAPHYYAPSVFVTQTWVPGSSDTVSGIHAWAGKGEAWDLPVLLGEFGIQQHNAGAADYLRAQYEAMDESGMHATLWEYSTTEDDWNEEGMSITGPGGHEFGQVEALVRAYPAAVAGRRISWRWDPETGVGELHVEARADGITELVVPRRLFPNGLAVTADGARWQHDEAAERLYVRWDHDGPGHLSLRPGAP